MFPALFLATSYLIEAGFKLKVQYIEYPSAEG